MPKAKKTKSPKSLFLPKGPVVEKMCESCPFKVSQEEFTKYANDHGIRTGLIQIEDIKAKAALGLPFYCHETVLNDETPMIEDPETAEMVPVPGVVYPHWKNCLGAVMYKRGELK